jgi:pyrroline-5-carboxylate reductase
MRIGLIGAGNMASALARGLGEPVIVSDAVTQRARDLVAELGSGEARSNVEVAEQADVVVLCHKPKQLTEVAAQIAGKPRCVVSILGGVGLAELEAAYPGIPVYRFMPNVCAEVGSAVLCYARGALAPHGPEHEILAVFSRVGRVIELDDSLMDTATALTGCAPAFFALFAEALAEAGVRFGLEHADAVTMACQSMLGAAEMLSANGYDTVALRRRVTSPGGSTARGIGSLERDAVRGAMQNAVAAVVEGKT